MGEVLPAVADRDAHRALTLDKPTLDIEEALKVCDENTICIVPIAGVTWTGLDDDIEGLDKALDALQPEDRL